MVGARRRVVWVGWALPEVGAGRVRACGPQRRGRRGRAGYAGPVRRGGEENEAGCVRSGGGAGGVEEEQAQWTELLVDRAQPANSEEGEEEGDGRNGGRADEC